jgi:hypothetical protein
LDFSRFGARMLINVRIHQFPFFHILTLIPCSSIGRFNPDSSLANLPPPPCRGRVGVGVELWLIHDSTPILAFPLQGGRNGLGTHELLGRMNPANVRNSSPSLLRLAQIVGVRQLLEPGKPRG